MSGSDILDRLVELDKKAGAMVGEARGELDETVSHIQRDTEDFRRDCAEKSLQRIEAVRQEEEKASQAQLESITRRYRTLAEGMEATYREKHTQWEDEIYRRCVGK